VFIEAKDDGSGGDNWSYKLRKAPVKSSPTDQHPVFFPGRMPFLSPNQQCHTTEGKKYHIPWTWLQCDYDIKLISPYKDNRNGRWLM